ncbi:MAG TPA: formate dehydrogenase accessory sulfurtransferase FdhD [Desulfobacteraceae bacterium]|nr:formate dehydrogenase accessory sulfurtransferase FdhD [Desulfobacteraceae bacterium]
MRQLSAETVTYFKDNVYKTGQQNLVVEEPLAIKIEGEPYSVVMRTPGNEIFHAAGFCLSEGIIDSKEDIASIGRCKAMDPNLVAVTLTAQRKKKVKKLLKKRGFISQTSCGICGKGLVKDLNQIMIPVGKTAAINAGLALGLENRLLEHQKLFGKTYSTHAAVLLDDKLRVTAAAEDVGRHNALDKAIGSALINGAIANSVIAVLSSRLSYELVQKGVRAGIEIIIAISRPTALAVNLAKSMNVSIARIKKDELIIFSGDDRFKDL